MRGHPMLLGLVAASLGVVIASPGIDDRPIRRRGSRYIHYDDGPDDYHPAMRERTKVIHTVSEAPLSKRAKRRLRGKGKG